jgi:hypothetical protein
MKKGSKLCPAARSSTCTRSKRYRTAECGKYACVETRDHIDIRVAYPASRDTLDDARAPEVISPLNTPLLKRGVVYYPSGSFVRLLRLYSLL